MRGTLLVILFALALIGCVNQNGKATHLTEPSSVGIISDFQNSVPEAAWGRTYYDLDSSFQCPSEEIPGYRRAIRLGTDKSVVSIDPCTLQEAPFESLGDLEVSYDANLMGLKETLLQYRLDPLNASEPKVDALCSNRLVVSDGQSNPMEMRLTLSPQPNEASFTWLMLGENYVSLISDNLMMVRSQDGRRRRYSARAGGSAIEVDLGASSSLGSQFPARYLMGDGVGIDLHCRLSR